MIVRLATFTLIFGVCASQPRIDISEAAFPDLQDVSAVQVFYLESPLFFEDFGDAASHINAYHAGLGFRYYPSLAAVNFVLEFCGIDVMGSVFPSLASSPPKFNNEAHVWYRPYINETYWKKASYVATLTAIEFQKLFAWGKTYHKNYQLWGVLGNQTDSVVYESQTCVDFVWEALQFLKNLHVAMDFVIPLKRDYINVHAAHAPELQAWESMSESDKQELLLFYSELSPEKFLTIMKDLQAGNFTEALSELADFASNINNVFYVPEVSMNDTFWVIPIDPGSLFVTLDYSDGGFVSPKKQWAGNTCTQSTNSNMYFIAFVVFLILSIFFCATSVFFRYQVYFHSKEDKTNKYDPMN